MDRDHLAAVWGDPSIEEDNQKEARACVGIGRRCAALTGSQVRSVPAVMHTALLKCLILCRMSRDRPTARFGLVDYFDRCPVPAGGFGGGITIVRRVMMSAVSSSAQSEFYAGLLPVEAAVAAFLSCKATHRTGSAAKVCARSRLRVPAGLPQ